MKFKYMLWFIWFMVNVLVSFDHITHEWGVVALNVLLLVLFMMKWWNEE